MERPFHGVRNMRLAEHADRTEHVYTGPLSGRHRSLSSFADVAGDSYLFAMFPTNALDKSRFSCRTALKTVSVGS